MRVLLPAAVVQYVVPAELHGRSLIAISAPIINTDIVGHDPVVSITDRLGNVVMVYPGDQQIAAATTTQVVWSIAGAAYNNTAVDVLVIPLDGMTLEEGDIILVDLTDGSMSITAPWILVIE